jgi:hypothetical protein
MAPPAIRMPQAGFANNIATKPFLSEVTESSPALPADRLKFSILKPLGLYSVKSAN